MFKKIIVTILIVLFATTPVFAAMPYQGYTYNYWGTLVPSPAAYSPVRSFTLSDLRCGENCGLHTERSCTLDDHIDLGGMFEPSDIHIDSNENIYIVDTGNSRIIVFDVELNLNRVIEGFDRNGEIDTLNRPRGIFVTQDMEIYISDTDNNRVVIIDEDGYLIREILSPPEVEELDEHFIFFPVQVLVDKGGRTFVISDREFQGIMSFDETGEFIGYYGTITVSFSPLDLIWRYIMELSDERINIDVWIPREFKGMSMDEYGFIFTAHIENWHLNNQIMRLNPRGEDVLVNFNDPRIIINGDQGWRGDGPLSGPSRFTDVKARSHGRYSALCDTRGRIFTYDSEGNLLYVFSGTGNMEGMSREGGVVSMETLGEDMFILDRTGRGRVIQFTPTEYGRLINTAIAWRYDGKHSGELDGEIISATDLWRKIAELDENYQLAWSGIGRAYLALGENEKALYYLERAMDTRNYSIAFRRHRLDVMQGILPNMMTGGLVLVLAITGLNIYKKVKNKGAAK